MRRLVLTLIALAVCCRASEGSDKPGDKQQNETESEDEQLPSEEPVEEFPGPFMIKRLNYQLVMDESEPDYFQILGVPRLSVHSKIRSSFRETARSHRDVLMYFRSPPNLLRSQLGRKNETNSTRRSARGPRTLSPLFGSNHSRNETQNVSSAGVADQPPSPTKPAPNASRWNLTNFMAVTEAYRVLTDPRSRRIYEVSGAAGLQGRSGPKFDDPLRNPYTLALRFATGEFKLNYGFKDGQQRSTGNVHHNIKIPMIGFYTGFHMDVAILRGELCTFCNGTGAAQSAQMLTCPRCRGVGKLSSKSEWVPPKRRGGAERRLGFDSEVTIGCKKCAGTGTLPSEPCPRCKGKKTNEGKVTVTVNIEPGMLEGQTFTFKEHAEQEPGAVAGDVLLHVYSEEHDDFEREANDLVCRRNITLMEALLGFKMEIKHLDGRIIDIERTEVTKPGQDHEIPGLGMPIYKKPGEFGKLVVKLNIVFPQQIAVSV